MSAITTPVAMGGSTTRWPGISAPVRFTTSRGGRDTAVELTRRVEKAPPRVKGKRPKTQTVTGVLRFTDSRSRDTTRHKIIIVLDDGDGFPIRRVAVIRGVKGDVAAA